MSSMIDRTYLRKAVRRRIVGAIVALALIAGMVAVAGWHISDIVRGTTVSYEQVTGDVIDEGEQRVREGGRRSKRWVTYRTVEVSFVVDGVTYSDSMRDEDLAIGEQVDVWIGPKDGGYEIFREKPAPADAWAYIWASVWLFIAILSLWGLARSTRRTAAIVKFDPQGRQPDMWFTLQEIKQEPVVKKRATPVLTVTGFTQTETEPAPAKAKLTLNGASTPRIEFPPQLPLFAMRAGEKNGPVVIYAQPANVFFAGDLVHDVTASQ